MELTESKQSLRIDYNNGCRALRFARCFYNTAIDVNLLSVYPHFFVCQAIGTNTATVENRKIDAKKIKIHTAVENGSKIRYIEISLRDLRQARRLEV